MIRALLRSSLRTLLRVRVEGDLGSLGVGRTLVVANHDSLFDGVLLGLFLTRVTTVVITPEALRSPLVRLFERSHRRSGLGQFGDLPQRMLQRRAPRRMLHRGSGLRILLFGKGQPSG